MHVDLHVERHVYRFYKCSMCLDSIKFLYRKICVERHLFGFYKVSMKIKCLHKTTQDNDQLLIYIVEWQYTIDPTYTSNYFCAKLTNLQDHTPNEMTQTSIPMDLEYNLNEASER